MARQRENTYQAGLIKRIGDLLPGCIILKNDAQYKQGFPDLTIFHNDRWAVLEVKAHEDAAEQPNQRHYVETLDGMSFSAFIFPENEEAVLRDLQQTLDSRRPARVSKSQQVPLDELRRREAPADVYGSDGRKARNRTPRPRP